jgi:hypothetical protein
MYLGDLDVCNIPSEVNPLVTLAIRQSVVELCSYISTLLSLKLSSGRLLILLCITH